MTRLAMTPAAMPSSSPPGIASASCGSACSDRAAVLGDLQADTEDQQRDGVVQQALALEHGGGGARQVRPVQHGRRGGGVGGETIAPRTTAAASGNPASATPAQATAAVVTSTATTARASNGNQ